MTVGKKIKMHRQNIGMSQEKLAELIGVSRQAVTKWELDQSAPNTENLFKLAEIFDTTVDLLLNSNDCLKLSPAEEIYRLYKAEKETKLAVRKKKRKNNILAALLIALGYLVVYFIGRCIWCSSSENSLLGWLIFTIPSGANSYLYGWLLSSNLFWIAMMISVVPSFFGKYKFSFLTFAAFIMGLLLGILLGPNPEGAFYGNNHYGWAIWGGIYLFSIPVGIVLEYFSKKAAQEQIRPVK